MEIIYQRSMHIVINGDNRIALVGIIYIYGDKSNRSEYSLPTVYRANDYNHQSINV